MFEDVDTRVAWVSGALPSDSRYLRKWRDWELDSCALYGIRLTEIVDIAPNYFDRELFVELESSKLYHFGILHFPGNHELVRYYFPNHFQLCFRNTSDWIKFAGSKDKQFELNEQDAEFPMGGSGTEFDTSALFDEKHFLEELSRLYSLLSLDDFNEEKISELHRAYLNCHGL